MSSVQNNSNRIKALLSSSPVKYVISSVSSFVVDNGLYYLMFTAFGSVVAQIIARALSSFFNFNMNRYFVFKNRDSYAKSMFKYYCLCIPQAAVSTFLVSGLVDRLSVASPSLATIIKIIIDSVLFVLSYFIQNKWVFAGKASDKSE